MRTTKLTVKNISLYRLRTTNRPRPKDDDMKQHYNAKPSKYANLGADILGAKRHNFDTYENPEVAKAKAAQKQSKKDVKALTELYKAKFVEALHQSTEQGQAVLKEYEVKKAILTCEPLKDFQGTDTTALRTLVLSLSGAPRELARKTYNRLINKVHKLRYIRPIELSKYFEPKIKNSFVETNGVKRDWQLETSFDQGSIAYLATITKGVQFGNSLPESEREYCLHNLANSLKIIGKYFAIDFHTLGFSFGARGQSGSIAHYQDSAKVIAINRSWDGALIHELGHAIDFALGKVSESMPYNIRSKYRAKLDANKVPNLRYYMKPTEIFARMFEVYFRSIAPETTDYMQSTFSQAVMPDLDAESLAWMVETLKKGLPNETK
jgi:hypothetical protein